ncbi:MAG: RNA polymerase sigma-70 factor [Flavobacteriaceae bacterium]|nr:RNA polymerase sigma-70 factor [Flavobacteriaceae bacterium]
MNLILEELRNQNHKAFKTLFNNHFEDLVVYANGYLFDMDSSKDLVQDVYIYIWENADKIDIKTNFKGYLYSMVRNRCFNYLKSIKITDNHAFLEFNINIITEHVFDSTLEEDKEKVYNQILKIVDSLPENMQKIVKLKFLHNYKYSEIAQELGISINTVKTQLKRAKFKIIEMVTFVLILLQIRQ